MSEIDEDAPEIAQDPLDSLVEDVQKLLAAMGSENTEHHGLYKELSGGVSDLIVTVEKEGVKLGDAQRCIEGLADELAKANARIDRIDADRDKMRSAFDQRYAEIVQAYEDAETGFIERLERMAALNLAQSKHMANQKQQLKKDKD